MKENLGRVVNYVAADGTVQAAIVVKVWDDQKVNLQVLRDGSNDDQHDGHGAALSVWKTSVAMDANVPPKPNTWHSRVMIGGKPESF